ncbi:hypothetical protein Anapl_13024 [Anas platyrhynchos]|uniref:Uncharacterized protein n=1 Tax=Anas platyrhynchos TaxID=8839 RepID=R0JR37_ANAPL|nr:hypothetical protein Anapl_13024 [Anas platyrhynchos]
MATPKTWGLHPSSPSLHVGFGAQGFSLSIVAGEDAWEASHCLESAEVAKWVSPPVFCEESCKSTTSALPGEQHSGAALAVPRSLSLASEGSVPAAKGKLSSMRVKRNWSTGQKEHLAENTQVKIPGQLKQEEKVEENSRTQAITKAWKEKQFMHSSAIVMEPSCGSLESGAYLSATQTSWILPCLGGFVGKNEVMAAAAGGELKEEKMSIATYQTSAMQGTTDGEHNNFTTSVESQKGSNCLSHGLKSTYNDTILLLENLEESKVIFNSQDVKGGSCPGPVCCSHLSRCAMPSCRSEGTREHLMEGERFPFVAVIHSDSGLQWSSIVTTVKKFERKRKIPVKLPVFIHQAKTFIERLRKKYTKKTCVTECVVQ